MKSSLLLLALIALVLFAPINIITANNGNAQQQTDTDNAEADGDIKALSTQFPVTNIFVANSNSNTISVFDGNGNFVKTISDASLSFPTFITLDSDNNLYVGNTSGNTIS